MIPVVAPLAEGPLNVNADDAAAALAVGLGAERILFLTDVPGVLRDELVLDQIGADEVEAGSSSRAASCRSCTRRSSPQATACQADIGATRVIA